MLYLCFAMWPTASATRSHGLRGRSHLMGVIVFLCCPYIGQPRLPDVTNTS
ncbi:MAG: hypothetical protein F6K50_05685 [Moorea sp. SIO3I7]|nr:hypothetical protein [Moorena sp. SIO3I7]